jgi:hypothetical protein
VHSIDAPRPRPAPRTYRGLSLSGELVQGEFVRPTLVLAVKEDCLGCRSVLESPVDAFGDVATLVVAARPSTEPWWAASHHPLVVSELLLQQLDVRWPPFYVLIDAKNATVVTEGVVFGPGQVREEIAAFLM